jgi:hypothetical protein
MPVWAWAVFVTGPSIILTLRLATWVARALGYRRDARAGRDVQELPAPGAADDAHRARSDRLDVRRADSLVRAAGGDVSE